LLPFFNFSGWAAFKQESRGVPAGFGGPASFRVRWSR